MTPILQRSIRVLSEILQALIDELKSQLPQSVQRKHYIQEKHGLNPWETVHHWYHGEPDADPIVMQTISDIQSLWTALTHLRSITTSQTVREPDLTLKKVRRTP